MVPILEAVPNFSEGRDLDKVRALVDVVAAAGADVLDWSADPDHHRSVLTYIGDPRTVEAASLAAARFAIEHFDLNRHHGVHPRVGALDVLPFVPLRGLDMSDAVSSAWRVGSALAEMGVPAYLYAQASDPPGRGLATLRKGGFEALKDGWPEGRAPDFPASDGARPHPTAGVTCVGARKVLLAWNVFVDGIDLEDAKAVASSVRERGGGLPGVRALGLRLERAGRIQISMNLEDVERTSPLVVLRAVEREVGERGGRVTGIEVIGMMPDALVLPAAADRLHGLDLGSARVLSQRVPAHVAMRLERDADALLRALERAGPSVPDEIRELALRLIGDPSRTPNEKP